MKNISNEKILCTCGCGKLIKRFSKWGRETRFSHGHNRPWKGKKRDTITNEKIRKTLAGRKLSPEHCLNISKSLKGKRLGISTGRGFKSNCWKGGRRMSTYGYSLIWNPEHPNCDADGYVFEHRLVMSDMLGRSLGKGEIVHHIDGNKLNNDINNLVLLKDAKEHAELHAKLRKSKK